MTVTKETVSSEPVAWECKNGGLRRLTQRQYECQPDNIKRYYTRIPPDDTALLRKALGALEKYQNMMFVEAGCSWDEGEATIATLRERLKETT
jgi:hypothetical protein